MEDTRLMQLEARAPLVFLRVMAEKLASRGGAASGRKARLRATVKCLR